MALKIKTKSEIRKFYVPCLNWQGVVIELSHIGVKESNQQLMNCYVRSGIKGDSTETQSTRMWMKEHLPMVLRHIHGWSGLLDSETNEPIPYTKEMAEFLIDQYGDTPLEPEMIKKIRQINWKLDGKDGEPVDEYDQSGKKIPDTTPTTLASWIAWVQKNHYAFDLDFENL